MDLRIRDLEVGDIRNEYCNETMEDREEPKEKKNRTGRELWQMYADRLFSAWNHNEKPHETKPHLSIQVQKEIILVTNTVTANVVSVYFL